MAKKARSPKPRRVSVKQQFLSSPDAQAQARLYLSARGIKAAKLSPAQLYRYTSQIAKAEVAGAPVPSLAELRGHPEEVTVQHIDEDSASRRREHYFLKRNETMEKRATALREAGDWEGLREIQFTHADFSKLVKAVQKSDKKAGHIREEWPIIVRGWAKKYPGWAPDPEANPLKFLKGAQTSATNDTIVYYIQQETQESLELLDFLNVLYGDHEIEWVDIQQIAIPLFYEFTEGLNEK